jgi:hypothetical protein
VTVTGVAVGVGVCDGKAVVDGVSDGSCPNAVGVGVVNPKNGVEVGVCGPTMVLVGTIWVLTGIRVGVRMTGVRVAGTGVVGFGIGVRVGIRVFVAVGGTGVKVAVGGGTGVNVLVGGGSVLVGGGGSVFVGGGGGSVLVGSGINVAMIEVTVSSS